MGPRWGCRYQYFSWGAIVLQSALLQYCFSGAGKTSLLRVLRGLWPGGQGIVAMVGADQVNWRLKKIMSNHAQLACLPQREFLGQGSLRDLLAPGDKGQVSVFFHLWTRDETAKNQGGYQDETSLIELLTLVGLDGLLSRCGGLDGRLEQVISMLEVQPICRLGVSSFLLESVNDFCGRESSTKDLPLLFLMRQPGEGFGRVYLELCSAVSEDMQTSLYQAAKTRGIGLISVGHRNSLR